MFVTSSACSVVPRVGQIETVPVTHSSRWRPQAVGVICQLWQPADPPSHTRDHLHTASQRRSQQSTNLVPQPPTQLFSKNQKSETFIATITSTVLYLYITGPVRYVFVFTCHVDCQPLCDLSFVMGFRACVFPPDVFQLRSPWFCIPSAFETPAPTAVSVSCALTPGVVYCSDERAGGGCCF